MRYWVYRGDRLIGAVEFGSKQTVKKLEGGDYTFVPVSGGA